jgi:spore coat polysaccharide biosynthesis protein SpsF
MGLNRKVSNGVAKLVLGGAQFGLDYGITNQNGRVEDSEIRKILNLARSSGVCCIDTANAYGTSETALGKSLEKDGLAADFRVLTKTPPNLLSDFCHQESTSLRVDEAIRSSLNNLRMDVLDGVLLHRAGQLTESGGSVWSSLVSLKERLIVNRVGVSVQTPAELELALSIEAVEVIQMPLNILDWRWDESIRQIEQVKQSRSLTIHIRSAFLQGMLLSEGAGLWQKANVEDASTVLAWLSGAMKAVSCGSKQQFCLQFVASQPWVDGVVVGVTSVAELEGNITALALPQFNQEALDYICESRPKFSESTLNPANWRV